MMLREGRGCFDQATFPEGLYRGDGAHFLADYLPDLRAREPGRASDFGIPVRLLLGGALDRDCILGAAGALLLRPREVREALNG